ncbi:hypothetical protein EDD15DRAFT_2366460 [Pisolithus albus]|nr:hypothetical protein EDD15DRAFT_2366460 [Pisolithus albus]
MSSRIFNITPRMLHPQAFNWLKRFAEGSVLMHTALDNIACTLGSDYDNDEWMDLTHHMVMEPESWHDIEKLFMHKLGIEGSSHASQVSTLSGNQASVSEVQASPPPASIVSAGPLLQDPSAWCLMMDWAQDKIGFGELDDSMRAYGSRYIYEEWKPLIDEVFMRSDPGADNVVSAPLIMQRTMESRGVSLTAGAASVPSACNASTLPPGATRRRSPCCREPRKKCRKAAASIFLDVDAEDEDEDGEEDEDEEESEEIGSTHRPQQVGPSGKGSYQRNIDILCERFGREIPEGGAFSGPSSRQIPAGIFLPPRRNIYIVDFYSASARMFAFEYIKLRGFEITTLPWLPHRLYVEASCPLEVQQNLPPSHRRCHKDIVLLPPQEGTSIMVFKARQILPTRNWVRIRIKKSPYNGNVGYVEESTESDAVALVAPCHIPYDLPEESGERVLFDVELARMAGLDPVPILSPRGTEIGYSCCGEEFVYGLLRLTLPVDTLELLDLPHPDDIRFHVAAEFDLPFVERTLNLFSAQFWQEQDTVEVHEGELRSKRGALVDVNWHKRSATVLCDDDTFECNLHELRRVFKIGDTVEVIAGPFCGETGCIVAQRTRTIVLVTMQANRTSDNIEVSRFVVQTHLQEHVLSLGPGGDDPQVFHSLSKDEALPGDLFEAHRGPYAGRRGIIEWISPDGKVWVSDRGKGQSKGSALADGQTPAPGRNMVAMDMSDLVIEPALNTLTFSKDKGYNVAVGDTVEVARGQWCHSEGLVKAVDLTKTSLDVMRTADGTQINVPITFVRKIKERSDYGLSNFVGRDVWIIAGDRKGSWATLRSLGRTSSWVGLFGQLIEMKNNQVATPTGVLLNGTLLPPHLRWSLKSLHSHSFITPVVPRFVTPLPSPGPSGVGLSDTRSVTPADITQTQTLDYGDVPWLFESDFCDFKSYHLGFNVSVSFTQVSLGKRVVRMVCPDRFSGQNGVAPPGSVCVTVTGHNAGSAMRRLTIPARYLTPANPTAKNQLCLVLKGPQAGSIVRIKKCQRNSKSVVVEDDATISFSDICVAFEYSRA